MGCVVELNAETDFVAKQNSKISFDVASKALELSGDFDATMDAVKDDIASTIATIGENMNLRRIAKLHNIFIHIFITPWFQEWTNWCVVGFRRRQGRC